MMLNKGMKPEVIANILECNIGEIKKAPQSSE